jgi:predicted dehydrogenase
MKTAIVGLGWWGTHVAKVLTGNDKFTIAAGVDPDAKARGTWRDKTGFETLDSYEAALADPAIDAVILTTPHSLHEAQVLAAVDAGKQIFCEKPLALTAGSARRMIDACNKAGIVLGIGHERRYEPTIEKIKSLVDAGRLGKILHVEANQSHNLLTTLSGPGWRGNPAEAPAAGWTGMGIHLTDALITMVGPVAEVYAKSASRVLGFESGDVVAVHLAFLDGTTGLIAAVSATPFFGRFAVFGEGGWAEAREISHPGDPDTAYLNTCFKGDHRQSTTSFKPQDAVVPNFEAWADAVAGRGSYRFTDEERFANVAVLEAIAKSVDSGKPEQVAQF